MKIFTTTEKGTLGDLVDKIFSVKGAKAAIDPKRAQAALRQANPQLGKLTKLPAGTLVLVPDVPGAQSAPLPSLTGAGPEVVAQLQQVLAAAKNVLEQAAASQAQDAATSLSLAKNRALVNAVKQAPALQSRLPEIANAIKAQTKQGAANNAAQLKGLKQLEKDLSSLNL
jgi:hypothetical protein